MKKLTLAICVTMLMTLSVACAGEMRGLWVDAWNAGFKSPAETTEMVDKAKDCGFNALFVQIRKRGDVYYRSGIEPTAADVAPGYDPLADVVKKAHAAKMQVHAWVVVYEVFHDSKWIKSLPGQVHLTHPEWLMKNNRGETTLPGNKVFLDPGVPEAQEYLFGILTEIAAKYDVDGIHLDVVRYPGREAGYNEKSVARFNQATGRTGTPSPDDEEWCSWRRNQVTDFMRMAKKATHKRNKVQLSVSVFANKRDAFEYRFQDWEGWLDEGLMDFVVPMVFSQQDEIYQATASSVIASAKGKPVVIGQGGWRLPAAKSLQQIDFAMGKGAKGIIVYDYTACCKPYKKEPKSLMDSLKGGRFSKSADAPSFRK